jgi:hypothetical protein
MDPIATDTTAALTLVAIALHVSPKKSGTLKIFDISYSFKFLT